MSMGMKLKPVKCRTFSVKSGSPADFSICDKKIPTIFHEEQKFLGKVLYPLGISSDTFKLVKTELFNKLENLDKTLIRLSHTINKVYNDNPRSNKKLLK